eukprot:CAMPEP_0179043336 /NCGR_PEP_ID=MMETSP0796-20121207/17114_1 /TAXON_ID=73915 /ORGANISM="Pyrodinium bahamense, Strain pbaha01" /LENGTH=208 /DNA_ID=CAMNT_0020739717 /DNA_START=58 /DNA_END=682 /DNA_ORIENTATION=+
MPSGTLKRWNSEKGFGFIQPEDGGEDIFCHVTGLLDGEGSVEEGDRVRFRMGFDDRKGKDRAIDVEGPAAAAAAGAEAAARAAARTIAAAAAPSAGAAAAMEAAGAAQAAQDIGPGTGSARTAARTASPRRTNASSAEPRSPGAAATASTTAAATATTTTAAAGTGTTTAAGEQPSPEGSTFSTRCAGLARPDTQFCCQRNVLPTERS